MILATYAACCKKAEIVTYEVFCVGEYEHYSYQKNGSDYILIESNDIEIGCKWLDSFRISTTHKDKLMFNDLEFSKMQNAPIVKNENNFGALQTILMEIERKGNVTFYHYLIKYSDLMIDDVKDQTIIFKQKGDEASIEEILNDNMRKVIYRSN